MEDFVTWVDTSKLKRTIMQYNDEVFSGIFYLCSFSDSMYSWTTSTCCDLLYFGDPQTKIYTVKKLIAKFGQIWHLGLPNLAFFAKLGIRNCQIWQTLVPKFGKNAKIANFTKFDISGC